MSKRKHRRYYGIRCMVAILITGALVTASGFVMRRTLLKGLPQYDDAPDIALPMMLLQDSSPVLEARERAAWEAENGVDGFGDDATYAMADDGDDRIDDEDEAVGAEGETDLARLVDSFDDSQSSGVMSVFNSSASAQTLDEGSSLPSLEELMAESGGSAVTAANVTAPTAEPDETLAPGAMGRVMDEPLQPADAPAETLTPGAMGRVMDEPVQLADAPAEPRAAVTDLAAQATLEPMETVEPQAEKEPEAVKKAREKAKKKKSVGEKYFNKTLFIGDSRTNGLQIWGRIGKAHYFCGTGYSVFNITKKKSSDTGHFKNVTLAQVLKQYKYNQIYIMLGFNESGYPYASLMKQYRYLISMVHKAQPKAKIILHGIMHTSYRVACRDKWASLSNLEKINDGLRKFAKSKKYIYYVDCNDAFCNDKGYLKDGTSSDGEHLNPKYTKLWAKEIIKRAI